PGGGVGRSGPTPRRRQQCDVAQGLPRVAIRFHISDDLTCATRPASFPRRAPGGARRQPAGGPLSPGLLRSLACPDGPPGHNTIRVMTSVTAWTRRGLLRGLFGMLAGAVARPRFGGAAAPTPPAACPAYRHDLALPR